MCWTLLLKSCVKGTEETLCSGACKEWPDKGLEDVVVWLCPKRTSI
jgi:hypothetical protein